MNEKMFGMKKQDFWLTASNDKQDGCLHEHSGKDREREGEQVGSGKSAEQMEALFTAYYQTLGHLCFRYFHYQSEYIPYIEDCIQEVFFHALKKQEKLLAHPNPYAWLANACKKECQNVMRRQAVRSRILKEAVPFDEQRRRDENPSEIDRRLDQEELLRWLSDFQELLTPLERSVYTQYFIGQKSAAEIASGLSCGEASVRGALQRIRKKARQHSSIPLLEIVLFTALTQLIR